MAEITGGELLLKCLQKEGLTRIIAINDASYHEMLRKSAKYGISFIGPRHESAAVHMAEGIYKSTGEITAVMAGVGPGAANLIPGIICAQAEGAPIIAITTQRNRKVCYPSYTGVFQARDQLDLFKAATKWNAVIHDWDRIPEIVQRAFREALTGRPGPVHIDVPDNVMMGTGDESKVRVLEPHQYRTVEPVTPSQREIEELADLIIKAKNPIVMAGTGVLRAEAWDKFAELVKLLNCPAITTLAGRTVLPDNHPNRILPYTKGDFAARKEADVVLAIGTCFGEIDLPFNKYWGGEDQKIIQVDADPRNIGLGRPVFKGIVGDAKKTLEGLVASLRKMEVRPADGSMVQKYQTMVQEWYVETLQPIVDSFSDDKIHPAQVPLTARKVFPENAICATDGGNTTLFSIFFTEFSKPRTHIGILEFGHLGSSLPAAIGAKFASPDQNVYCISGDGAAGFNIMEMETAVRHKVKITLIVCAESSWGMEETLHHIEGDDIHTLGLEANVRHVPVRWDKIGEALGCHGEFVEKPADLYEAIKRAKEAESPAVVCVKTDLEANLSPPAFGTFIDTYIGCMEE